MMNNKVENLDVCNYLKDNGYKYSCSPKSSPDKIWATKAKKLKSGTFSNKSKWDCFLLTETDIYDKPLGLIVDL